MMTSAVGGSADNGLELCLLSLDGGGVRGLSSLLILKKLMEVLDPYEPPKARRVVASLLSCWKG